MRTLTSALCTLALAALVAGCGSSAGSDGSDDGPTTTKAAVSTTTTADETSTTKAGGGADGASEADYLQALQTNLSSGSAKEGNLVIAVSEAECVAPTWLKAATVDAFVAAKSAPDDVSDPTFDFSTLELDEASAQAMIAAFEPCGVDIYRKLAESLTEGLTEEQQACAMDKVDDDLANALLLTAFGSSKSDGTTEFGALLDQLRSVCDLPAN